jgi:TetR/AcrR family transcriptional regulator, transcriptional repressor for nem operon
MGSVPDVATPQRRSTPAPDAHLTPKGRATRARILEIAAHLMFERGVAETSIEAVKRAAGVSASQIYHYFGDREGLVRAVVAYLTDLTLERQRPLIDELDSFDAFRAWRNMLVETQRSRGCEGGCTIGSLAAQLAETVPLAREDLVASFARWEAPISQGLRAMQARGELRSDARPEELALAVMAALQGGLLLTQTRRETTPLEVALDHMIERIESFAS